MSRRIVLSGAGWRLRPLLPSAYLRPDLAAAAADPRGWLPASVPGSVQHDLWRAGELADPYAGRNSLAAEWAERRTWLYAHAFAAAPPAPGGRARLRLEGLDYTARVFLNGAELGEHANPFAPFEREVGALLRRDGPNELLVALAPAPDEQDQMGRTSLVRSLKPRMGYWWDFCPRLVNLGLGDVSLELSGPARVADLWARPRLSDDRSSAELRLEVELDAAAPARAALAATVELDGRPVGAAEAELDLPAGASRAELRISIADPQLWWPNGAGAQPLYLARLRVSDASGGAPHDERAVRFGLRTVELAPNATPDSGAPPYSFVVNGQKTYITGWNWVPIDALYSLPRPAKLRRLLQLARRAGANLLRVCGVGLIESAAFYELCDELGIMVWQEFPLSSSDIDRKPAEEPGYIARVVDMARRAIPQRRNHPALVVWCGGNELESLQKLPLDDSEPVLAALRDVVAELDPGRHWLPTSARGRKPFNGLSSIRRDPDGLHDVHGPWLYEGLEAHYELYNAGSSLFHSELGAEALSNLAALRALLPAGLLRLDALDHPTWRHLSAWWLRREVWGAIFGPVADLAQLVRASQFLQAEAVRYAIESNRRRAWRNSGSLPWQLNEPYPMAACTSAVDYFGRPRPLYAAVAAAFAPLALSARYETLAWGGRERFAAAIWSASAAGHGLAAAELSARVVGAGGAVYAELSARVAIPDNAPAELARIELPLDEIGDEVFFLDLRLMAGGAERAASRYLFSRARDMAPLLALPPAALELRREPGGLSVINRGPVAALLVRVEDGRPAAAPGFASVGADHFSLLPGEERRVAVEWEDVPPGGRLLSVGGWNTESLSVEG